MSTEDASGGASDGNEEHIFGHWKKSNPGYKVAGNLPELWFFCWVGNRTC